MKRRAWIVALAGVAALVGLHRAAVGVDNTWWGGFGYFCNPCQVPLNWDGHSPASLAQPAYRVPYVDPTTKALVMRVSPPPGTTTDLTTKLGGTVPISPTSVTWGNGARHHYSKTQPFDASGRWMQIQNRSDLGGGDGKYYILDSQNNYEPTAYGLQTALPSHAQNGRWHPKLAATMIAHGSGLSNKLYWLNLVAGTKLREWTLPIMNNLDFGQSEGNVSHDGRYAVFGNNTDGVEQLVVVDMDPQYISTPSGKALPACRISADDEPPPWGAPNLTAIAAQRARAAPPLRPTVR